MARSLTAENLDACFVRYDEVIKELSSRKKQKKGESSLEQLDSWCVAKLIRNHGSDWLHVHGSVHGP